MQRSCLPAAAGLLPPRRHPDVQRQCQPYLGLALALNATRDDICELVVRGPVAEIRALSDVLCRRFLVSEDRAKGAITEHIHHRNLQTDVPRKLRLYSG